MISKDYTQEVGLESGTKTIPRPLAGVLLARVAAGIWFAIGEARDAAQRERLQKQTTTAASVPAQSLVTK